MTKRIVRHHVLPPFVVQYRFVLRELGVAPGLGVLVPVVLLPALMVPVALDPRFAGHGRPGMVRTPLEPVGGGGGGNAQQQQQDQRRRFDGAG